MPNSSVIVTRAKGDAEITPVSTETEVRVPWLNYGKMSIVLMFVCMGAWCIGWLLWARTRAKSVGYWRWLIREWAPWFSIEWVWVLMTLILCWIGPSAAAYLWYLLVELLLKRTPAYTPWPSEWGMFRPQIFKRFYPPGDEPEPEEMEHETQTINLWDYIRGRKSRKRKRQLPDFLVSNQARTFYRSVVAGTKPFSQRGAAECGISRGKFNRHVFEPLQARGMADWKDEKNHKKGIDLSDDALQTLELLGRHPLPQKRA